MDTNAFIWISSLCDAIFKMVESNMLIIINANHDQEVIHKLNYICRILLVQCFFQELWRRFNLRHQKTFPIFLLTHYCAQKSARRSVCPSACVQWNKEQRYQCARVQPIGALLFWWRAAPALVSSHCAGSDTRKRIRS